MTNADRQYRHILTGSPKGLTRFERKWVQVKGGQRPSAHKTTRKVVAARKRGREIWRP